MACRSQPVRPDQISDNASTVYFDIKYSDLLFKNAYNKAIEKNSKLSQEEFILQMQSDITCLLVDWSKNMVTWKKKTSLNHVFSLIEVI